MHHLKLIRLSKENQQNAFMCAHTWAVSKGTGTWRSGTGHINCKGYDIDAAVSVGSQGECAVRQWIQMELPEIFQQIIFDDSPTNNRFTLKNCDILNFPKVGLTAEVKTRQLYNYEENPTFLLRVQKWHPWSKSFRWINTEGTSNDIENIRELLKRDVLTADYYVFCSTQSNNPFHDKPVIIWGYIHKDEMIQKYLDAEILVADAFRKDDNGNAEWRNFKIPSTLLHDLTTITAHAS